MNRLVSMPLARQATGLFAWLLLTFMAAAIGASASVQAGGFYLDLVRPAWAPPAWLFGPVWSVLYIFMGVSAWLVWRTPSRTATRTALMVFVMQLAANALWTWLFFVWHQGAVAFAEILLLWALILATILMFARISKFAAALLLPYLVWVGFASALNFALWSLNPGVLG